MCGMEFTGNKVNVYNDSGCVICLSTTDAPALCYMNFAYEIHDKIT